MNDRGDSRADHTAAIEIPFSGHSRKVSREARHEPGQRRDKGGSLAAARWPVRCGGRLARAPHSRNSSMARSNSASA
ncbi:hypothetical protein ACTMU2_01910 [Cupriavidus basilensis]